MLEIMKMFDRYSRTFKKYNIEMHNMGLLQNDIENGEIKLICTHYKSKKLTNGKWSVPVLQTEQEFDAINYLNVVSAIPIFKDRVSYELTKYGRIPMSFSCISWGTQDTKSIRKLEFKNI